MRCVQCNSEPANADARWCVACGGTFGPDAYLYVERGIDMVAGQAELLTPGLRARGARGLYDVRLRVSSILFGRDGRCRIGKLEPFGPPFEARIEVEAARAGHGTVSFTMVCRESPDGELLAFTGQGLVEVAAPSSGNTSIVADRGSSIRIDPANLASSGLRRRGAGRQEIELRYDPDATDEARIAEQAECPFCGDALGRAERGCTGCGHEVPSYVWAKTRCRARDPRELPPATELSLRCTSSGRTIQVLSRSDLRLGRNRTNDLVTRVEPVESYRELNRTLHRFYGDLRIRDEQVLLRAHKTPFGFEDGETGELTAEAAIEVGLAKVLTLRVEPFRLDGAGSPLLAVGLHLRQPANTGNHMHPYVVDVLRWVEIGVDHAQRPGPVVAGTGLFRIVRSRGQFWVEPVGHRPVRVRGRVVPRGTLAHLEPDAIVNAGPCTLSVAPPLRPAPSSPGSW